MCPKPPRQAAQGTPGIRPILLNMSPSWTCPNVRRIAVLTGGGDCPGLNAVIRAVGRDAFNCGLEVFGVEDGYLGLIENRIRELRPADLSGILHRGGTILGSNNKSN